ncbi:unnamed protein product [Arabis nemorensis]|uniref:Ubiquitin-like protease family profile domain-containing protein n=1 Tax=Arabis nemorensis TaxID=586526 RepID=A0A565ASH7_9BRAS|nr:unnamed protein product [Arabis nemorensis]
MIVYRSIPLLLKKVPNADDEKTFMDAQFVGLPKLTTMSMNDIVEVERDSKLTVTPVISIGNGMIDGWGDFDDELRDRKLLYMQDLICKGYVFNKLLWPGGDSSIDVVELDDKIEDVEHEKHVVDRKGKKVASSGEIRQCSKRKGKKLKRSCWRKKQQKINRYFGPATRGGVKLKEWVEAIEEVKTVFSRKIDEQGEEIVRLKKKRKGEVGNGNVDLFVDVKTVANPTVEQKTETSGGTDEDSGREEVRNGVDGVRGSNVLCNVTDEELVEEAKGMEHVCRSLDFTVRMVVDDNMEALEEQVGVVGDDGNESEKENLEIESLGEPIELSDSSPSRKKELIADSEIEKSLVEQFFIRPKRNKMNLLPSVDHAEYAFFEGTLTACPSLEHVTDDGLLITSRFLLELAKPKEWLSTLHMEVLKVFLGKRHEAVLEAERSLFVSPWMITFVAEEKRKWFEHIDTVYVPMCWEKRHWVGLVIHLNISLINLCREEDAT